MKPSFRFAVLAVLAAAAPVFTCRADTVDWSTILYAPTAAQATTKTNVQTVNGVTTAVQFSNSTYFSTAAPSPDSGTYAAANGTNMNTIYANGGTTGAYGLQLPADFTNSTNTSSTGALTAGSSVTVTVFFSKPVLNTAFSFYDVDSGTVSGGAYTDQLTNIVALGVGGVSVAPATLTAGADNMVSGSGFVATANNAQNAAGGNAAVSFGATPITQFSYTYKDNAATDATHSVIQIMALGNITYAVPEPSTWLLLLGGACLLGLVQKVRTHGRSPKA